VVRLCCSPSVVDGIQHTSGDTISGIANNSLDKRGNIILRRSTVESFWGNVDKSSITECWNWNGCILGGARGGYGLFGNKIWNGERLAHRISWLLNYGEIPDGLCVLHKCDNRKCVNPEHLFLGTNYDNVLDRQRKGRGHASRNVGMLNGMSTISDADVLLIRSVDLPLAEISSLFNVAISTVSMIRNNLLRGKITCQK